MDTLVTPRFDHVFVVLDDTTYGEVTDSPFLREQFGRVKLKRSTSSIAGTYAGVGVAGTNTLAEFFPAAAPPFPGLSAGLVFSFEVPGTIAAVRRLLDERGATALRSELVTRTVDGSDTPQRWYELAEPDLGADSPIRLMFAEVTPDYFASIGAACTDDGRLLRSAYLDAALGRRADPGLHLRDVTGVTLRLHAERAKKFIATLATLGFHTSASPDGHLLYGPDATIRLIVDEALPEGVLSIELDLNHPLPQPVHFGTTSVLDGTHWTFTP